MRTINSLVELDIPEKHASFLVEFLKNVSQLSDRSKIERLVLFGSCARGDVTDKSDIDIAVIGEEVDDEILWKLYDCTPRYIPNQYVENDIIAMSRTLFEDNIAVFGKVQKYIAKDGIDLSGLLL
jgi:predicted nucleotidyltransferase